MKTLQETGRGVMAENERPEIQQEFFQEFSDSTRPTERFSSLSKSQKPILINTSVEQIIIAAIVLILVCCAVFFLGILRGQSLSKEGVFYGNGARSSVAKRQAPAVVLPAKQVSKAQPAATSKTQAAKVVKTPMAGPLKPYTIQLASYTKEERAKREAEFLRQQNYFATVLHEGDYFVLCAGQYANRDEAEKDRKFFSSKYNGCFLRRYEYR